MKEFKTLSLPRHTKTEVCKEICNVGNSSFLLRHTHRDLTNLRLINSLLIVLLFNLKKQKISKELISSNNQVVSESLNLVKQGN